MKTLRHETCSNARHGAARSRDRATHQRTWKRYARAEHSSRAANLPFNAPRDDDRRTFRRALLVEEHPRSVLPQRDLSSSPLARARARFRANPRTRLRSRVPYRIARSRVSVPFSVFEKVARRDPRVSKLVRARDVNGKFYYRRRVAARSSTRPESTRES